MKQNIGKLCRIADESPLYSIEDYSKKFNQYLLQLHSLPKDDCLILGWVNVQSCRVENQTIL